MPEGEARRQSAITSRRRLGLWRAPAVFATAGQVAGGVACEGVRRRLVDVRAASNCIRTSPSHHRSVRTVETRSEDASVSRS
jgi:hypothetical protein